ncbi:MAG: hypothetical protein GX663_01360 [Clostridiales bacterium]|nr:hypothetical protein [Clostridiales bacterium]
MERIEDEIDIKLCREGTGPIIVVWIKKNLEGCSHPRQHGKALTEEFRGYWRHHIGDYRHIRMIKKQD